MNKIAKRAIQGREKYGTTMERDDLTQLEWLIHAQEEAMDLAVYLERLIQDTHEIIDYRCHSCGSHSNVHECWQCEVQRCINCDLYEMRSEDDGHTYCNDCVCTYDDTVPGE